VVTAMAVVATVTAAAVRGMVGVAGVARAMV
jgi:hypothetical protein